MNLSHCPFSLSLSLCCFSLAVLTLTCFSTTRAFKSFHIVTAQRTYTHNISYNSFSSDDILLWLHQCCRCFVDFCYFMLMIYIQNLYLYLCYTCVGYYYSVTCLCRWLSCKHQTSYLSSFCLHTFVTRFPSRSFSPNLFGFFRRNDNDSYLLCGYNGCVILRLSYGRCNIFALEKYTTPMKATGQKWTRIEYSLSLPTFDLKYFDYSWRALECSTSFSLDFNKGKKYIHKHLFHSFHL